jgi:hypothetical protein
VEKQKEGWCNVAKVRDGQMDPDDVEEQYQRHKKMQQAGYYDKNKSKKERLSIVERIKNAIGGGRGSAGGGGMNPTEVEKGRQPGKLKMKKGGFIKDAIKKPGALRKSLGVKKGEKIPESKLAKAAKAPGKMGQRARLAQTLKKMK